MPRDVQHVCSKRESPCLSGGRQVGKVRCAARQKAGEAGSAASAQQCMQPVGVWIRIRFICHATPHHCLPTVSQSPGQMCKMQASLFSLAFKKKEKGSQSCPSSQASLQETQAVAGRREGICYMRRDMVGMGGMRGMVGQSQVPNLPCGECQAVKRQHATPRHTACHVICFWVKLGRTGRYGMWAGRVVVG